jgi:hypothetical protein
MFSRCSLSQPHRGSWRSKVANEDDTSGVKGPEREVMVLLVTGDCVGGWGFGGG